MVRMDKAGWYSAWTTYVCARGVSFVSRPSVSADGNVSGPLGHLQIMNLTLPVRRQPRPAIKLPDDFIVEHTCSRSDRPKFRSGT